MCKYFFLTACLILLLTVSFGARPVQGATPGVDEPSRVDRHGDPLPAGAIARLGTVRWRQRVSFGDRVCLSPDGKVLALTDDSGLRLWDVATGKPVSWAPDRRPIHAAIFSPDGKTLITGAYGPREKRSGDPDQVKGLIERWEVGTGKRLHQAEFDLHRGSRTNPAFSADGKFYVQNVHLSKLSLWDAQTGTRLFQIEQEVSAVPQFSLSADNRLLAVLDSDGHLRLYDRATGKELRRILRMEDVIHLGYFAPALSPDGKLLAASTPSKLCVWDTATGEMQREFKECHGVPTFSADGKYLACGDRQAIRLWDTASFREVRRFEEPDNYIEGLAFSADGRLLASIQRHSVGVWDVATGKQLNRLPAHNGTVYSLTFTPSGAGLVSGADDGVAIVWDLATAQPRHRLPGHYAAATSLACSPDGKLLATGDGQPNYGQDDHEAQIRLWNLTDGTMVSQFTGHLHGFFGLAFSPDGKRLASVGMDARFRLWDPATGKRLYQVRGSNGTRTLAFSPDGKMLVFGNTGGELGLWQASTGQKLRDLGPQGQVRRHVVYASFLRDGKTVISEEQGGNREAPPQLRFWDAESGREIRSIPIPGSFRYYGSPSGHTVSADGSLAATVSNDRREPAIQLRELSSGKMLALLRGHAMHIPVLAFSPDGKLLASGSHDSTVLIWDVEQARMQHYWSDLLGGTADARNIQAMAAEPARAVAFLKDRLSRSAEVEARARRLIAELDDDQFTVRDKASRELERLGPAVEAILRTAAKENPSPEARRRIQTILVTLKNSDTSEAALDPVRAHIAVTLLEKIDTPESRRTIGELARGPADATVTREARAALERLKKPAKAP
jgi:WD40 repeat protein